MQSQRLDSWLWCARFYRTRGLAVNAIKGGKVEINGCRAKPAKMLQIGDQLVLRKPPYTYEIKILDLVERRVSAGAAATLYRETETSRQRREDLRRGVTLNDASRDRARGKPSKKERRVRQRLKRLV
jgi:ribosome-associated heat shock protein Hsp15